MLPMPMRLLIHSATLNNVVVDENLNEQDNFVVQMYHVRFEPSTRVIVARDNTDVQCVATLYIDAVKSQPQDLVVSIGQSIVWDGNRYKVADVARLYDEGKYHHMEVELTDG